jgi:hypothetical protein
MTARLSADQTAHFRREGYLLVREPVLPEARFAALRRHFATLHDDWIAAGRRPEHMDMPHLTDPALFEFLLDRRVLDVVESLIGPDIALWASHFICKPPGTGKRVPWHEDSAYWGTVLQPMEVVTLWLALDRSDPGNGCMRVIPRTHHHGYSRYERVTDQGEAVFDSEVAKGVFDEASAIDCVLEPNQCSLHHAKLIHGSQANASDRRRCGYTMRYISTSSRFDAERARPGHEIFLARGRDRAGNRYGEPGKANAQWQGERFTAAR